MFIILDYSSALEYSIIRRYTNIVYYCIIIIIMFCVYLSMGLFVLCVACLTVIVNCLVKQFAICLGVVVICC